MARIRTIKPEFFTSEDIVSLTPHARLLYIALWCEADREGRLVWRPTTFKIRYFPIDNCDIETMCDELISTGLVKLYGDGLAHIPSFKAHQHVNPRETESKLQDPNATVTRGRRVGTRANPDVNAQGGRERKGKEGNDVLPFFDRFWLAYPRKVGKDAARKAFDRRKVDEDLLAQMLSAIAVQAAAEQWRKDGGKFIPHPATWLNEGRWQDETAQSEAAPNLKPGTDEYFDYHKGQPWWREAGFSSVWDAANGRCYHHNASAFRSGKRLEAA